jgi:hypothetical protein
MGAAGSYPCILESLAVPGSEITSSGRVSLLYKAVFITHLVLFSSSLPLNLNEHILSTVLTNAREDIKIINRLHASRQVDEIILAGEDTILAGASYDHED